MIYITINKKGGVCKSTFANQILTSYLFNKTKKKVKLYEIDDENKDSESFSKSEIMNSQIISTKRISSIDSLFFSDEDIIIDIGGNKTATIFLDEMKKVKEYENIVWFIPLTQGEQDNLNAVETYGDIKKQDPNAKIIFVLSRTNTDDLEWEFVNFFGSKFLDIPFAAAKKIKDIKYLSIKSNAIISNTRYFEKTVYDLSISKRDLRKEAKAEKNKDEQLKLIFLNRVKNEAIEYVKYLKDDVYTQLDELLK